MDFKDFKKIALSSGAEQIEVDNKPIFVFYKKWISGGQTGGSCWDVDGENYRRELYDEGPLEIDTITSFLASLNLNKCNQDWEHLVKDHIYEEGADYYGNYYQYTLHYVLVEDLHKAFNMELEKIILDDIAKNNQLKFKTLKL